MLKCTTEKDLLNNIKGPILEKWQQRQTGHFKGKDNTQLEWVYLKANKIQSDTVIIVVNGRAESYWRYQEVFYNLLENGFDIISYDHRGQGASQRLTTNKQLGHVNKFNDYIDDLDKFINTIVMPHNYKNKHFLAHSMGGAITSLFLAQTDIIFNSCALCSPMHGINLPFMLKNIAPSLTKFMSKYKKSPSFVIGHGPYKPKPFINNPLTQSQQRYNWSLELLNNKPELQIGGPSDNWVYESIIAGENCLNSTKNITTPLFILQAGNETIVDNKAQNQFYDLLIKEQKDCQWLTIPSARHEILFEIDEYRQLALKQIIRYFDSYNC